MNAWLQNWRKKNLALENEIASHKITVSKLEDSKTAALNLLEEVKTEIAQRKQTEEKIRETQILLQASIESPKGMIILAIDKNYRYLNFNSVHKQVMSLAYGKDVKTGMNLIECITNSDDRRKAKINYDRALNGESHITVEEYGDLERYYYETRYNPIFNEKKEVIGATAFSANITDRKQAEFSSLICPERFYL
jgi:PAS domain S-box-containing protein